MGYHFLPQGIFPTQDQTRISCLSGRLFTTEPGKVQGFRHKQISCGQQLILCCKYYKAAATAAKLLQSCLTLCDPIDGGPPGSPVPGILQARTLEWVAISFSSAWKGKWKWSRSVMSDSSRPHGLQPTRLLRPWDFPGKSTGVGCHCLLQNIIIKEEKSNTMFPNLALNWGISIE